MGRGDRAALDQLAADLHCGVDGDGKADTLGFTVAALGIDNADQLAVCVEQTAAGVARADGGIGLDQRHIVVLYGNLTVQRTDDAVRDGVGQRAERVAHRHGDLADGQCVTVTDDRRGQTGGVDLQHRDVGGGILPDNGGIVGLIAAVQLDLTLVAPLTTCAQVRM